jgi:hypothetical protein
MTEQYFEMLWDCPQCDAKDLLSKTHRHCPSCGAAQDPARRHFPRPDQEVEVLGHRFVGVDWHCGYCEAPNSAAAAFCINCGGPQEGAAKVKLVQEPTATVPPVAPPPKVPLPPKSGLPWFKLILIFLLLAGVGLGYLFFSKHDEQVTVVDKTWNRQIDVERFTAVRDSAWCDAMPADAYQISRSREQRSTRQIPDGQDCVDVRADVGDGTFSKRRECTPRYREEPQYDMKCSFRVNRWRSGAHRPAGGRCPPGPGMAHAHAGQQPAWQATAWAANAWVPDVRFTVSDSSPARVAAGTAP